MSSITTFTRIMVVFLILMASYSFTFSQEVQYDSEGFEIFEFQDKDTVYTMKKYFMVFLKSGTTKIEDPAEAMRIQKAHLDHMSALGEQNKLCIAGPFGDDTEMRGVVIYNVKEESEAISMVESDPAVMAGILTYELHPWWAAKGSKLP